MWWRIRAGIALLEQTCLLLRMSKPDAPWNERQRRYWESLRAQGIGAFTVRYTLTLGTILVLIFIGLLGWLRPYPPDLWSALAGAIIGPYVLILLLCPVQWQWIERSYHAHIRTMMTIDHRRVIDNDPCQRTIRVEGTEW